MVKKYSIAGVGDNFTSVVHETERGTQVELTRQGKTVAVLTSAEDFEQSSKEILNFGEAYEKFRREFDLEELDIDPDEVFGNVRP